MTKKQTKLIEKLWTQVQDAQKRAQTRCLTRENVESIVVNHTIQMRRAKKVGLESSVWCRRTGGVVTARGSYRGVPASTCVEYKGGKWKVYRGDVGTRDDFDGVAATKKYEPEAYALLEAKGTKVSQGVFEL